VCDLENLKNEKAMTRVGSQRHSKKKGGGGFIFNLVFLGREILGSHGGSCEDYRPFGM